MACAAMLLPVAVSIAKDAGLTPGRSNFGRALLIAVGFGPLIGGIATPAGTAANIVAMAQLQQLANVTVTFTGWMVLGVPAALMMVPVGWWILLKMFPPEMERLPISEGEIARRLQALGPLSRVERHTLAVFAVAVALWMLTPVLSDWTGGRVAPPIEAVALAAGLYLFLPGVRVLTWKQAEGSVEWGGLMLIAAGLSLGLVVYETGAARWLAWVLLGQITLVPDPLKPFVIVLAVSALHLLFSSNTVTATIIVPILVALAKDLGLDVWTIVAPAAFTSSLAFILLTEGPTTLIPYAAGYFSIKDMAKAGILMTVAAAICVALAQFLLGLAGLGDAR
jgi:sodium-dependent dicarboxylate transporter 2/3/5